MLFRSITLKAQEMRKDLEVARRAEQRGDVEGAQKAYDSAENRRVELQKAQIQAAATNRDVNAQKTPTVNINQPQTLENQRNPNVLNPQSGGSDTSVLASWEDSIYRWLGIQKGSNFA